MKKKLLCLFLSVIVCVFFAGCGRFGDCDNDDDSNHIREAERTEEYQESHS